MTHISLTTDLFNISRDTIDAYGTILFLSFVVTSSTATFHIACILLRNIKRVYTRVYKYRPVHCVPRLNFLKTRWTEEQSRQNTAARKPDAKLIPRQRTARLEHFFVQINERRENDKSTWHKLFTVVFKVSNTLMHQNFLTCYFVRNYNLNRQIHDLKYFYIL